MFEKLIFVTTVAITSSAFGQDWDLSALPHYVPENRVSGTIRMTGASMAGLVKAWQDAFHKYQPNVTFLNNDLVSSDVALPALIIGSADLAPCGREPSLDEILGFTEKYNHDVLPIIVATGAWDTPQGSSWSPVVFVSKDNPIQKLTMEQLDGIFGAERTGGYEEGSKMFLARDGRGPEKNIRTWGQLGVTGEWKDKPIQTYGYAQTGMRHFFELRVFHGGDKWNPNYREYVETGTAMVAKDSNLGSHDMLVDLSHDKYGIGWSGIGHARSVTGLKPIALAPSESARYFEPTAKNFQTHDYPLSRNVFIYLNRTPGTPVDPKLKEFLTFVLSQEGQRILTQTGSHLPLTRQKVLQERERLDH